MHVCITELDTGQVDLWVGLGRVGSSDQICQKLAQFLSSVIYTVVLSLAVCSLNKSVKCFLRPHVLEQ